MGGDSLPTRPVGTAGSEDPEDPDRRWRWALRGGWPPEANLGPQSHLEGARVPCGPPPAPARLVLQPEHLHFNRFQGGCHCLCGNHKENVGQLSGSDVESDHLG